MVIKEKAENAGNIFGSRVKIHVDFREEHELELSQ